MHGIEARNITAAELSNDPLKQGLRLFNRQIVCKMLHELRQDRLRLPNNKKVDKGRQGLGVDKRSYAAANDQRLTWAKSAGVCAALFGQRLNTTSKKQGQQVEKILFKTQGAKQDREIAKWTA